MSGVFIGEQWFNGNVLDEILLANVTNVIVTGSYAMTVADDVVVCNSSNNVNVTLPNATGSKRGYTIKNIGAGLVTVLTTLSATIDGETTQVLSQDDGMQLLDYATNKWIVR